MACMAPSGGDDSTKTMVTSTGYCFSDASAVGGGGGGNQSIIQSQVVNQYHHQTNFDFNPHEMYGLTSGMELLGFPQKNNLVVHHQAAAAAADTNSVMWKEFFGKSAVPSTSKAATINEQEFNYHQSDFSTGGMSDTASETLMGGTNETWHHHDNNNRSDHHVQFLDDPSLRSCVVFPPPCDQGGGNERPNQGLSLSLGSSDPARIGGLQSFELRQQQQQQHESDHGFFGNKSTLSIQQQQQLMQQQGGGGRGGILGKVESINNLGHFHHQNQFHIRSSKYLAPAQDLLNEFCNLGTKQQLDSCTQKLKIHKSNQQLDQSAADQEADAANTSSRIQSLYSTDLLELQKRKSKLLQMLEEVDRRYKHYCDQMKAVVSSFEAVAGNGAAMVYSTLASKAMSRHFRSLRDGIIVQIKATKKALGEKDTVTPGGTRGETPRLRVLDQTLRQQRAFQQMSMMETHPWRPQRGLPERAVSVLRAWLFEHFLHPYPSEVDKHILSRQTGLTRSQVSNWFINARVRLWKPMVEEMYVEETKEQENMGTTSDINNNGDNINGGDATATAGRQQQQQQNSKMVAVDEDDQKPTHEQLVRIDSECLSSIIHNSAAENINKSTSLHDDDVVEHVQMHHHHHHNSYGNTFGAVELDFSSSYNHNNYGNRGGSSGVVGGGNVSLTLGLQQHGGGGGGGGLAFSPGTGNQQGNNNNNLYYSTREHNIESCTSINVPVGGSVQYSSLLDTEITQNLPYRNLMGAQLLHDLAG